MHYESTVALLIGLQVFHVVFLFAHDWVPLGKLNDVEAQRRTDTLRKRLQITVLSGIPYLLLLGSSWRNTHTQPFPTSILLWLWIGYGLLFAGELNAWWIPYFLRPDVERVDRYKRLFGTTHAFLVERNGIRPNTLHAVLHTTTLALLVCLGWLTWTQTHA